MEVAVALARPVFEGNGQFVIAKPVREEDVERVIESLEPPMQAFRDKMA